MKRSSESDSSAPQAKRQTTGADAGITARLQQVYNVYSRKLYRANQQLADLFIYPPVIFETVATGLTTVMDDISRGVRENLRSRFDEQQASNHRTRVQSIMANTEACAVSLSTVSVQGIAVLLSLTGIYLHDNVTVNEIILQLQTWDEHNERDEDIKMLLSTRPETVKLIRAATEAMRHEWDALCDALTHSRDASHLRAACGETNVFKICAAIKWADVQVHPLFEALPLATQVQLAHRYRLFMADGFRQLMSIGLTVKLLESSLDARVDIGLALDYLTTTAFEDVLTHTSHRMLTKTNDLAESTIQSLQRYAAELNSALRAFADYYTSVRDTEISTGLCARMSSAAQARMSAFATRMTAASPSDWAKMRANPSEYVPKSEALEAPNYDILYHVFIVALATLSHPKYESNAPALQLDWTCGDLHDELKVCVYPQTTSVRHFRRHHSDLIDCVAWKQKVAESAAVIDDAINGTFGIDMRINSGPWVIKRIQSTADHKAFMESMTQVPDESLFPFTAKLIAAIRLQSKQIIYAICGGDSPMHVHLNAWRARIADMGFNPVTSSQWIDARQPADIGLSGWAAYRGALQTHIDRLAKVPGDIKQMLAVVKEATERKHTDAVTPQTAAALRPSQVRLLKVRIGRNASSAMRPRALLQTPTQAVKFALSRVSAPAETVRREVAYCLMTGMRRGQTDFPEYEPLDDTTQVLGNIVRAVAQTFLIETLQAVEFEIEQPEKVVTPSEEDTKTNSAKRADGRRRRRPAAETPTGMGQRRKERGSDVRAASEPADDFESVGWDDTEEEGLPLSPGDTSRGHRGDGEGQGAHRKRAQQDARRRGSGGSEHDQVHSPQASHRAGNGSAREGHQFERSFQRGRSRPHGNGANRFFFSTAAAAAAAGLHLKGREDTGGSDSHVDGGGGNDWADLD
jgi:hypothetical protein